MELQEIVEGKTLYDDGVHKFIWLGWEEEEEEGLVQTNQYLIINKDRGILLDPGGVVVFPRIIANVAAYIDLRKIGYIFFSHQDPDVSSSMNVWLENTPANVYISKLWHRFVPHFGNMDINRIIPIDDKGGEVRLPSGDRLRFIPSHFLHSTGCFSLYDERSGILFTGDIGAAVFPKDRRYLFVENFEEHANYMEGFHRRYMASNKACRKWASMVESLNPKMIAPQHGAIFKDENVSKFLNWFRNLQCGVDIIEEIY